MAKEATLLRRMREEQWRADVLAGATRVWQREWQCWKTLLKAELRALSFELTGDRLIVSGRRGVAASGYELLLAL